MRYLVYLCIICSFKQVAIGQSQGVTNSQTKLRPNQLRWSPTDATLDSVYIIRADTSTGEPGWYLVTLGGGGNADTTLAGDVVGGLNSTFVRKINGVTVENKTPQGREVLQYDGTQWTPDSIDLADLPTLAQNVLLGRGSASTGSPQPISLGTGLSMSGTTLSNSSPDQTVSITSGTGISATGTYPNFTVTNTSPDQTVSITGGGINAITGTYPNFIVTGTELDGSVSNEGSLTVGAGTASTSIINSNTSGSTGVTLTASTGLTIGETGNVITLTNSAPDQTVSISGATGTYPNFTVTPTAPGGSSTQLQYNNAGAFAGSSQLIANIGATNTLDITGSGSTSATNALRVRNSSGTDLLNIRNDGKVGIGTTTPNSKVHVYSSSGGANSGILIESSSATEYSTVDWKNNAGELAQMFFTGSSYHYGIWESNEAGLNSSSGPLSLVAYDGSGYIKFGTGGFNAINERMRITSSGKVGISTTTPLAGLHNAINTTASTPSMLLSGTGYSGGTATTTKPTLLIEPTGTTSTGWNTSGTKLGVNAESGFTGRLLDLQLNGVSQLSVAGTVATIGSGSTTGTYLGGVVRTTYINDYNNNVSFFTLGSTNAIYGGTLLQFNGSTSSYPAIKRNGTGLDIRLADDSGYATLSAKALVLGGINDIANGIKLNRSIDGSTMLEITTGGSHGLINICGRESSANGLRLLGSTSGRSYIDGYSEGSTKAANYDIIIGSRVSNTSNSITGTTTAETGSNVQIGFDATSNPRALLSLNSTTRGFLPTRMTTTQRDSVTWVAGDEGMIIFNTTTKKHQGWDGTTWNDLY